MQKRKPDALHANNRIPILYWKLIATREGKKRFIMDIGLLSLGNGIALLAELVLLASSAIHDRKRTLIVQVISNILNIAAYFILGGYAGAAVIVISAVRSTLFAFGHDTKKIRIGIIIAYIIVTVSVAAYGNFADVLWFMPLLANLIYTWWGSLKGYKFKIVVALNCLCWIPYSLFVFNFVSAGFETANVIINAIVAYRLFKKERDTRKDDDQVEG